VVKIFKGGEKNEKDCFDDFVVGFCFRDGRMPPSPSPPEKLL